MGVNSVPGTPLRPVWVTRILRVLIISHCCGEQGEYNWRLAEMIRLADSVLIFISDSIIQWHATPPPRYFDSSASYSPPTWTTSHPRISDDCAAIDFAY